MYAYLAKVDPEVKKTKFEQFHLEILLPEMCLISEGWRSVEAADFVTSNAAIASMYYCVRSSFKFMDMLRKKVQEYIEDHADPKEESEEETECSFFLSVVSQPFH